MASVLMNGIHKCWVGFNGIFTCCGRYGKRTYFWDAGYWITAPLVVAYLIVQTIVTFWGGVFGVVKSFFRSWKTILFMTLVLVGLYFLQYFWYIVIQFVIDILVPVLNFLIDLQCLVFTLAYFILRIVFYIWNALVPFLGMLIDIVIQILVLFLKILMELLGSSDLIDILDTLIQVAMQILQIAVEILSVFLEVGVEILTVLINIIAVIMKIILAVVEVLAQIIEFLFEVIYFVLSPIIDVISAFFGGGSSGGSAFFYFSRMLLTVEEDFSLLEKDRMEKGVPFGRMAFNKYYEDQYKKLKQHNLPSIVRLFHVIMNGLEQKGQSFPNNGGGSIGLGSQQTFQSEKAWHHLQEPHEYFNPVTGESYHHYGAEDLYEDGYSDNEGKEVEPELDNSNEAIEKRTNHRIMLEKRRLRHIPQISLERPDWYSWYDYGEPHEMVENRISRYEWEVERTQHAVLLPARKAHDKSEKKRNEDSQIEDGMTIEEFLFGKDHKLTENANRAFEKDMALRLRKSFSIQQESVGGFPSTGRRLFSVRKEEGEEDQNKHKNHHKEESEEEKQERLSSYVKKTRDGRYVRVRMESDHERYARVVRTNVRKAHEKCHRIILEIHGALKNVIVGGHKIVKDCHDRWTKEGRYALMAKLGKTALNKLGYQDLSHVKNDTLKRIKGFINKFDNNNYHEWDILNSLSMEDTWIHQYFAPFDPYRKERRYWKEYHAEKLLHHIAPHLKKNTGTSHKFKKNHHDTNNENDLSNGKGRKLMTSQKVGQGDSGGSSEAMDRIPTASSLPLLSSADCFSSDPRNILCLPELPEKFDLCLPNIIWPNITGNETCRFFKETTCIYCWDRVYNVVGWFRTIVAAIFSAVIYTKVLTAVFPFLSFINDWLIPGGVNNSVGIVDYFCMVKYLYDVFFIVWLIYMFYTLAMPLLTALYEIGMAWWGSYKDFKEMIKRDKEDWANTDDLDRCISLSCADSMYSSEFRKKLKYRHTPSGYKEKDYDDTDRYTREAYGRDTEIRVRKGYMEDYPQEYKDQDRERLEMDEEMFRHLLIGSTRDYNALLETNIINNVALLNTTNGALGTRSKELENHYKARNKASSKIGWKLHLPNVNNITQRIGIRLGNAPPIPNNSEVGGDLSKIGLTKASKICRDIKRDARESLRHQLGMDYEDSPSSTTDKNVSYSQNELRGLWKRMQSSETYTIGLWAMRSWKQNLKSTIEETNEAVRILKACNK